MEIIGILNCPYKISDRKSDDNILHFADIISGDERKKRIKALAVNNVTSPPFANDREKRYRPIIEWIRCELRHSRKPLWDIDNFEIKIDPGVDKGSAAIETPNFGGGQKRAFVKLPGIHFNGEMIDKKPMGIEYLWRLFHEFGHVLVGSPENPKSIELYGERETCERETHAWNFGWSAVKERFPALLDDSDLCSYLLFMNQCIKTYLEKSRRELKKGRESSHK